MTTQRNALSDGAEGAVNLPAAEPYAELILKALVAALKLLPAQWSDGWLTLDRAGRWYLNEEGIVGDDLRIAVNAGVHAGHIRQRLSAGVPCIALAERAVRR